MASMSDRMKLMLSSGKGADVHFLVGQSDAKKLLAAHKTILISASEVFETMFRFDAKNSNVGNVNNPVEVPDVEVGAFNVMLSFIYADDLAALNGHNAMAVLYTAKKYNIVGLVTAIKNMPIAKICDDVFMTLAQSRLFEESDFAERSLAYIDNNADSLIRSKEFLQIDQQTLGDILGRSQLAVEEEITIWQNALRWADEKCRQNGKECSGSNRRAMLGPALYKIRFPRISQQDLCDQIVLSGVLTHQELLSLFLYHARPNLRAVTEAFPLKFSTNTRAKFDDRRKSTGRITLKIDNFFDFTRKDGDGLYSDVVYIMGIPMTLWAISSWSKKGNKKLEFELLYDVESDHENRESEWCCFCSASFWIVSQWEGYPNYSRITSGLFYSDDSLNANFSSYIMVEKLLNSENGWYDKNSDTVTLMVDVTVDFALGK
ncbi:hypothetical protein niasHT_011209 [Heterodera trifolii]|uniref:BTB domain-containing protein n=1 Tax=Heterodera trifolii TaxID=157864 RepID=A0ABD2L0P3_9BILA